MKLIQRNNYACASAYGAVHALIDAASAVVIYCGARMHGLSGPESFNLVVAYNVIAFGAQPIFGLCIDALRVSRAALITGVVLVLAALPVVQYNALAGMAIVATGNALFHLGGGSIVLSARPGSAALPGIFVGPGAFGLSIGVWLGFKGIFPMVTLMALLAAAIVLLCVVRPATYSGNWEKRKEKLPLIGIAILLLLVSIFVRALIGNRNGLSALHGPVLFWLGLGLSGCMGKIFGGIIADRFGWIKTVLIALALATPLIVFGGKEHIAALTGIFLFQMTMPVTLAALALWIPGKPAFAFGMACLALLIGTLPSFFEETRIHFTPYLIVLFIGASALCIWAALRPLRRPGTDTLA
jgi:FSR family fosmidomycin resistance protein-like MFS transporter